MEDNPSYVIRGGLEGRERLRVLSRVMWPTTSALFAQLGVAPDARCLDIGCGGGDVSLALAALAPAGSVVGVDLDATKVDLARADARAAGLLNVSFRVADVMATPADVGGYDVIYIRFVLTHLTDPASALTNVTSQLATDGVLIVEEIDFDGNFCHPHSPAFWRYVEWYKAAVIERGADPNIGPRVPSLLADAGLTDVGVNVVQPAGLTGEVKLLSPITLEAIADAVLGAGLTSADNFAETVDELYEFAQTDGTLMSVPRIVQSWGRKG